jgi:dihydrodipicolinate synthase/N-acetylneuraminate lyase
MPANLLPFRADLEIDEPAYRRHLRWLADAPGVTGIVANGHAAEVSSLTREERKRALAIALDEVAGKVPVVAGVYSDGTREAVELARDAHAAGAAGLLVFPPTLFMWGAQWKPDMVLRHFSELADGVDLPLVVFEYPPASGIGYQPETLAALCKIPSVVAVKDWSNDIVAISAPSDLGAWYYARPSPCRSSRASRWAPTGASPAWGAWPPTCRRRSSPPSNRGAWTRRGPSTTAWPRWSTSSTHRPSWTCTTA